MHDAVKRVQKAVRRWGFFEYALLVFVIVIVAAAVYVLRPKTQYATVQIRVGNRDLLYADQGSVSIIESSVYRVGLEGKDILGRLESKILDVEAFPHGKESAYRNSQSVYVTLKIAATVNERRNTVKYKGATMQIGDWARVDIGPLAVEGIVTDINGKFDRADRRTVTVEALLKTEDPQVGSVFMGTTGVDPYIADAIKIGDAMLDSQGRVMAKIAGKRVEPARTVMANLYGDVFERPNPRKLDVTLTVELSVKELDGNMFFMNGQPIKVNSRLPLFLNSIDIEPRITRIVSN